MRRSDRLVGSLLIAPLLVAIAFSWFRLLASTTHTPRDADYAAAKAILAADGFVRGEDALAILPPWSLRPLTLLGGLDPISGDALDEQPLQRYRRLFVLVEPDAGPVLERLTRRLGAPTASTAAGRVKVLRFDLSGPRAGFDLRERLGEAHVRIVGEHPASCDEPAEGPGFLCRGRPNWQRVTRQWLLVSENADDAVWSHPPPRGERLEISWDDVPMGSSLVVRAGHLREGAEAARAPVRLHVEINGERVGTVTRAPAFHFRTDTVDTGRFAGTRARLTLVEETDDEGSNHFAWDAFVVGGP